jgi:hypothetical protein
VLYVNGACSIFCELTFCATTYNCMIHLVSTAEQLASACAAPSPVMRQKGWISHVECWGTPWLLGCRVGLHTTCKCQGSQGHRRAI